MNDVVEIVDLGDAVEETKQPPEGPVDDNVIEFGQPPLDL